MIPQKLRIASFRWVCH